MTQPQGGRGVAALGLLLRRSTVTLPVNVPRFLEKAHLRAEDAIILDLEDSVPAQEKDNARRLVRAAIAMVARGGAPRSSCAPTTTRPTSPRKSNDWTSRPSVWSGTGASPPGD